MASPKQSIRKLSALSSSEMAVLAQAWLLFAWVDLNIRYRPYARWRHWLGDERRQTGPAVTDDARSRVVQLAEIAARHHWAPMNCLRRSLVQKRLLAGRGVAAALHIGVRVAPSGAVEAHAWLSADGHLLNDTAEHIAGYQALVPDAWDHLPSFTPD
ncbi:MAG TPA: lasso peptide biosynthesis B2 protein [Gammaproteobacteria bacterium]|nr:lasso peptide biosynthesis B2 protein [Gammaproteobacteria bacterium]